MTYLTLKYLHILSMVLLFGTGLGSAFYKWMADRSTNLEHIAITNRNVVLADWLFTTPTIIFQPVSGIWMAYLAGIPLSTFWISTSLALYLLAGACWLPVVWLQIRMSKLADAALKNQSPLTEEYWQCARKWFWLGVPAFASMLLVVFLMIFKTV
ncbi:MAG: DUF2269 domain-containing protein [Gammaproteobacteria bacterium]|nr:DUF2269 domain-containing protein [Gammaproteobacteria bacterium]